MACKKFALREQTLGRVSRILGNRGFKGANTRNSYYP